MNTAPSAPSRASEGQKALTAHKWSSDTFADIADISQARWHYEGTRESSQTTLCITFPDHRISIQLDRQIMAAITGHASLTAENAALREELQAERNLHGQTRVVVEELNTICNDLRNAGEPQFIRSEAIRLLREDQAELRGKNAALRASLSHLIKRIDESPAAKRAVLDDLPQAMEDARKAALEGAR